MNSLRRWMLVVAALACSAASAQDCSTTVVSFTWTAPVAYENDDPLPLSDITNYTLYDGSGIVTSAIPPAATTWPQDGFACGSHDFTVTVTVASGEESAMSNVLVFPLDDTRKPRAPTLLDVVMAAVLVCDSGEWTAEFDTFCAYYAALKD